MQVFVPRQWAELNEIEIGERCLQNSLHTQTSLVRLTRLADGLLCLLTYVHILSKHSLSSPVSHKGGLGPQPFVGLNYIQVEFFEIVSWAYHGYQSNIIGQSIPSKFHNIHKLPFTDSLYIHTCIYKELGNVLQSDPVYKEKYLEFQHVSFDGCLLCLKK